MFGDGNPSVRLLLVSAELLTGQSIAMALRNNLYTWACDGAIMLSNLLCERARQKQQWPSRREII